MKTLVLLALATCALSGCANQFDAGTEACNQGNWKKAMETWAELKTLQKQNKNMVLTNHTVISNFNIDRFFEIYAVMEFLEPASYIT